MINRIKKNIKIIIVFIILLLFIWFLGIYPFLKFKGYEKVIKESAIRYYDINYNELPSGSSIEKLELKTLYSNGLIKNDFYIPYSNKLCSIDNSWIKIKKDKNDKYKYYPYLECGVFKSKVDHEGPIIKLKGDNIITLNKGDKYQEYGVLSVKDKVDGKLDINGVLIDSSSINTDVSGSYKVKYTAVDSFLNKTTKYRTVKVIQRLDNTVKNETDKGIYKGLELNNYIRFSGVLYRIIGLDRNKNVKIVSQYDISNVNYNDIDDWLLYFYDNIAPSAKKYLVKNEYCTGTILENDINSNLNCIKKSSNKYVSILSNNEINNSFIDNESYLLLPTISWINNDYNKDIAWGFSRNFLDDDSKYYGFSKDYNFGIRPLLTIKGDSFIINGDGSLDNPYLLDDINEPKGSQYLNTRYSGEYISYSTYKFRIIDVLKDGSIKVVSTEPIRLQDNNLISYSDYKGSKVYNPNQKGNIGYLINKLAGDTINEKYFVTHEINVPIYKTISKYNKPDEIKKYKVKFSAPNMYDMFTASRGINYKSYWLLNSSLEKDRQYFISNNGVVAYTKTNDLMPHNIKIIGFLNKDIKIVSGKGTENNPYKIKL